MGGAALALVCACPGLVGAQTPQQRAGVLLQEGDRLYSAGQARAALKRYLAARRIHAHPQLSYKLGITLLSVGRHVLAAEQLQLFLARAKSAPAQSRRMAAGLLRQLQRVLGSVSVACPVAGVTVLIDGRMVGRTPLSRKFFLKPGKHQIVLRKAGYLDETRDVVLEASVHRQLDLVVRGSNGAVARAPAPPPAPPPAQRPRAPQARPAWEALVTPRDQQDQRRRRKTIIAYTTLGVGVALLAGASVLYGVGASKGSEAHDQYLASNNQPTRDYYYADVEAAQTMLAVGHLLAGLGAVALGVSIYNFVTRPGPQERGARISISPGGLVITGAF